MPTVVGGMTLTNSRCARTCAVYTCICGSALLKWSQHAMYTPDARKDMRRANVSMRVPRDRRIQRITDMRRGCDCMYNYTARMLHCTVCII